MFFHITLHKGERPKMLKETMKQSVPEGSEWFFDRLFEMVTVFIGLIIFESSIIIAGVMEDNLIIWTFVSMIGMLLTCFIWYAALYLQKTNIPKNLKWSNSVLWIALFPNYTVFLVIMEFMSKAAFGNFFGIRSLAICILLAAAWATVAVLFRHSAEDN